MIECPRVHDLLEAEPEELSGAGTTPLARHVRGCERCAVSARMILGANAGLEAALNAATARVVPDLDALIAEARVAGVSGEPARPRHAWRMWATLAAAATVVGLLLLPALDPSLPGVPLEATAAPAAHEIPAGRDVAIIATDNPDITILWFFEGGSR